MDYLISASQGAIRSLPGKIESLLLEPENGLRKGEKDALGLLKSDLREIIDSYLMEPSEVETPAFTANCWVKEVRELSYDIDDFIDKLVHDDADARIVARLRKKLNPRRRWITDEISGFRTRVKEAIQRYMSYNLDKLTFRPLYVSDEHRIRPLYGERAASLVDIDSRMNKLEEWLTGDVEQNLRVVSIVGFGGVGKTTLAKELYCKLGGRFGCRAFVRSSRKPDVRKLLTSILSQLRVHQPPNARAWGVDELINKISTHLQSKRYFMIVDDIWTASTWDIVSGALPEGNFCSRILTTTEIEAVAQTCCGYNSKYILKMEPLSDDASRKLFCSRVFGHPHDRSKQLTEASYEIARKCGGFPLAIITIASLLASHLDRLEPYNYIKNSLSSNLRTDPTLEGMTQVLNVSYNNLPQHLRACMLYFSIYQENCIIRKDNLVKKWINEDFISAIEGKDMEEVAMSYFGELVNRGLIQPVDINYNDEVLSCTVHYMVLDLIQNKCIEENFVTTIDRSHTTIRLADKIRRLSLHFGNEEDVTPPASLRLSQVRSLAYFGLSSCMPSITGFKLVQVLILHLWGDQDNMILDLNTINRLFRLRNLDIACNVTLEIQSKLQGLKYLETIKIDAIVSAVEADIVNLPGLLHLTLPSEINPPIGIDHMTLLRTLGRFNLSSNSEGNVESLGKLTNLRNLHLTCSAASSDSLDKNMKCLGSVLEKLSNLTSITLVPAGSSHAPLDYARASGSSISHDGLNSISARLERLELSRRICTFSSLHGWIGKLDKLCILKTAVRELSRNDIDVLKGLPALTALSLYVQTAPVERIVFGKAGFLVLKYFKFKCSVPWLKFEADAMPNLRKLMLGFNALGDDQHVPPISIEHLPGLKEISAKIGGAGSESSDAASALGIAVRSHPRNPKINVQGRSMVTKEKQYGTLEEQDEILEEDPDKHYRTEDEESGEDENKQAGSMARQEQEHGTPIDQDKIMEDDPNKDSGEEEKEQTCRRISTSPEPSSHMAVPGGAGSDADSALAIAVSSHPRNPRVNVQGRSMVTKEKQYGTPEEHEILEEDPDKHYGTQDGESGEDENKQAGSMARQEQEHGILVDQDKIMEDDPDVDSGEDENKQSGRRISTLPESSSHLPVSELKKDESKQAIVEADAMVSASTGAMNSLLTKLATLMGEGYAELGGMREELKILKDQLGTGMRGDVKILNDQLGTVSAFLGQLADMSELSMEMKAWRNQMREMTYDIEDHIDEIMLHFEKWVGLLKRVALPPQKRVVLRNFIHQIRRVGMLDLRPAEMRTWGSSYMATESRLSTAYCNAVGLVGMDGPRDELVRRMMSDGRQQKVVCILGPGGLGKTTLAKEVHNKIEGRFDCQLFVPVPQKIGITSLLKTIRSQLTREPYYDTDMEGADLINSIRRCLQDKRYLVVIDGVWSISTWRKIKSAFSENNRGSRVIVTTRVSEIAESCSKHSSGFIHRMRPLPAQDSQILFRSIIFGSERSCPVAFEKIADKILEACGGVPLAIIIIAVLLASKPAQVAQWEMVEKRMDPAGKGDLTIQGMKKILDICYSDLPRCMKSCLLYLSVFPENHVIRKDRLIWRWIAEGLIPRRGEESSWETGESYFQELISRKLIESAEDEWDEKPLGCKVHGLILEFITSLSNEEGFVTTDAKATFIQHGVIRRLTVNYGNQEEDDAFRPSTVDLSKVRSLTISGDVPRMGEYLLSREHFRVGLRFLRVLDLVDAGNLRSRHLKGIERSVLLRYLGLGGNGIGKLPEEIGELEHLETLDLRRTTSLRILPASIVGLRKLVRLLLRGRVEPPEGIWKMQELEEVSTIDVGSSSSLNSVSGLLIRSKRLRMLGVRWDRYSSEGTGTNRLSVKTFLNKVGKSSLQSLLLESYPAGDLLDFLLDSWVPPHHLRRFELRISGTRFRGVPPKMASLVNLTHLRIRIDRVETDGVCILGALPNLILLNLDAQYYGFERLIISRDGFRCLVVFSYTCGFFAGMELQFTPGAMPQLRRLRFEFYARETESRYGDFDFGIQHLSCLTRVHATIRSWDPTDLESVDAAEAAIIEQVSKNPNSPVLELKREHEVSMFSVSPSHLVNPGNVPRNFVHQNRLAILKDRFDNHLHLRKTTAEFLSSNP